MRLKSILLAIFVAGLPFFATALENHCLILKTWFSTVVDSEESNSIRKILTYEVFAQNEQDIKTCWEQIKPNAEIVCEPVETSRGKTVIEVHILNLEPHWGDKSAAIATGTCVASDEVEYSAGQFSHLQRANFKELKLVKTLD